MWAILSIVTCFLVVAARYSGLIELWGDETFSLNVAARSIPAILEADPFHLPTYYLLLHPFSSMLPAGSELVLRLIHALIFSIGLVFCWRIAASLLHDDRLVWLLMGLTILLPNYLFYATNIRMYAPLFAASMAVAWTAFRLLEPGGVTRQSVGWHLLSCLICALIDLPGLLLVVTTWTALLLLRGRQLLRHRRIRRPIFVLALITAAAGAGLLWAPIQRVLTSWPTTRTGAAGGELLRSLAKQLFLQTRPLLDLVYPPTYPVALNLMLWLLITMAVPAAAVVLWRRRDARARLVAILAFSWLLGSPLGLAVTRAFLPAQFFMLLCLVLALAPPQQRRARPLALLLAVCLAAVGLANLQQALVPTLRLYSRIPYTRIAADAVEAGRDQGLSRIVVSRHTLNALSVARFARPLLSGNQTLELLASKPDCSSYPRGRFLYVQLLPEDGEASDPAEACAGITTVHSRTLRTYVPLEQLGYNRLWASNLSDKADTSASAARLLLVSVGS